MTDAFSFGTLRVFGERLTALRQHTHSELSQSTLLKATEEWSDAPPFRIRVTERLIREHTGHRCQTGCMMWVISPRNCICRVGDATRTRGRQQRSPVAVLLQI